MGALQEVQAEIKKLEEVLKELGVTGKNCSNVTHKITQGKETGLRTLRSSHSYSGARSK
jgi:hypothetical protein